MIVDCKRFIDILGRSGHILRGVSREVNEETRSRIEYIKDYEGVSVGLFVPWGATSNRRAYGECLGSQRRRRT